MSSDHDKNICKVSNESAINCRRSCAHKVHRSLGGRKSEGRTEGRKAENYVPPLFSEKAGDNKPVFGERTGLVVRASDSGSGDPGSILGRVGVLFH